MHKERQAARLDASTEAYRTNEFDIGSQFIGLPHLDHARKAPQFPGFEAPIEGYAIEFNVSNDIEYWHPQRGHSIYDESKTHGMLDIYSARQPQRSHTWPPWGHPDSTYGSQLGGGTTPSLSDSTCFDSRTEISCALDDSSSYTNGVMKSRQPRTKSIEDNKLRCDKCQWVGKTPSEKRKHDARHRKEHRCGEDGCEARFGTRNDLERHRKSVHSKCPQCGPKETYKCFGRNCGHPEKVWPRLDNFKAHLRLKHSEEDEEHLLSQSRIWYEKRKTEEVEKGKRLSNTDAPTTPTITPSTLINSLNQNPGDYFDTELGNLTLKPIGHPQSLSANISPEYLQTPNELLFSPLKAGGSSFDQGGFKLRSIHDLLTDVTPCRRDDLVLRTRPDNTSSKGGLPGVESFDHAVASMKLLDLVAKLQNNKGDLSHEEKKFCQEIASNLEVKGAQDTSKSEEDFLGKLDDESTEKLRGIAKEGPKQEGFGCSICLKSFNRLSVLKKHRKRHEKPYGCTFAGCYGRFGSKADWKRHESMQHCHTQSFRCSLPRGNHPQCAKLFLQQEEFVQHLKSVHPDDHGTIERQVATSRIGTNDAESKFSYWCGFCKKIKTVEKTGIDAQIERYDHIDSHFKKDENIKRWVPAKGHTEKGAQKKRDKSRTKKSKRSIADHLEENSELLYDNGCDDAGLSTYEQCSSSEEEIYTETKPRPDSYGEENDTPKSELKQPAKDLILTICCQCMDGPQMLMNGCCIQVSCQHYFCSQCHRFKAQTQE